MSALRRFIARIANLLFPGRADRALARELRSHVAFLEDEYRSRGLSPEDARRSAAHALGGVEQTIVGALAGAPLLSSLLHGVDPSDRSTLATAIVVLISTGVLAALLASVRVLWIAPADTLRTE